MIKIKDNVINDIKKAYEQAIMPDGMSLYDFSEVCACYNALNNKKHYSTINGIVAKYFKQNDFNVSNFGIGYLICI